jgi:hypothetical protein
VWAIQVEAFALDQPFYFQVDACVDDVMEMLVGVFEGESIGVNEVLGDLEMELGWKSHE